MSGHIWLTENPDSVPLDRSGRSLWVYADKRRAPQAERVMKASTYLGDPWRALEGVDLLIVVGMTDIVTPANRVKTGPFLNEPWRGPCRESVDRCLFLGEPWRAWWHWGCVGSPWDDVPHSFALEGRWNQALDNRRPDPCSLPEFLRVGQGVVVALPDAPRFGGINVKTLSISPDVHEAYQAEKEKAFEEETTWRGLVRRLGAFAQAAEPRRSMPTNAVLFRSLGTGVPPQIVATDLPVDTWLCGRYRETVNLVDGIADGFQEDRVWTP